MTSKFLLSAAILILTSCAIPGSMLAKYKLKGKIIDAKTKKPLSDVQVRAILPGTHGLSSTEAFMAPFEKDKIETPEVNAQGEFTSEQSKVVHASFFLLPPIGWYPKQMYPPFYLISAKKDKCVRLWRTKYGDEFKYQLYSASNDEFINLPEERRELSGKLIACKENDKTCATQREVELEIIWNSDKYCNQEEIKLMKKNITKGPRRHEFHFGYGETIKNGLSGSYEYAIDRLGIFKFITLTGFSSDSNSLAALFQMTILGAERLRWNIAIGQQFISHDSYRDEWGAKTLISLRYDWNKRVSSTIGFSKSRKFKNEEVDNLYGKIGWKF